MRKRIYIAGGITIVAIAAASATAFLIRPTSQPLSSTKGNVAIRSGTASLACKDLNLADAKALLGPAAKPAAGNGKGDATSSDAAISSCIYMLADSHNVNTKDILFLVRTATAPSGADYNKAIFGASRPTGKKDVPGVADAAFWDADVSQLNVLQGNNWYIIGNRVNQGPSSGTLDMSVAIYDQIKHKL